MTDDLKRRACEAVHPNEQHDDAFLGICTRVAALLADQQAEIDRLRAFRDEWVKQFGFLATRYDARDIGSIDEVACLWWERAIKEREAVQNTARRCAKIVESYARGETVASKEIKGQFGIKDQETEAHGPHGPLQGPHGPPQGPLPAKRRTPS